MPDSRLLAGLPDSALALLLPHLEQVELTAGQVLSEPDDILSHVIFPEAPVMVGLYQAVGRGQYAKAASAGSWDAFGLIEALGDHRALSRAVVVMPGLALRLPADRLPGILSRSLPLRQLIHRYMQAVVGQISRNAACNAQHTVGQRVARWLLAAHELVRDTGGHCDDAAQDLPLTQETLADVVGVQRTTITMVTLRLKQAGLITYRRGRICVADRPGLETRACDCTAAVTALYDRLLGPTDQPD